MNKRGAADAQGRAGGASGRTMPTPCVCPSHPLTAASVSRCVGRVVTWIDYDSKCDSLCSVQSEA